MTSKNLLIIYLLYLLILNDFTSIHPNIQLNCIAEVELDQY